MMRCSRSRTMSTLLVLVGPSPPDTSAPHDRQNLRLPGIGVWQRKHSTTGLVIGAACPDGPPQPGRVAGWSPRDARDRKSTRLNSSHSSISYAVFCLKKKKKKQDNNNIFKTQFIIQIN